MRTYMPWCMRLVCRPMAYLYRVYAVMPTVDRRTYSSRVAVVCDVDRRTIGVVYSRLLWRRLCACYTVVLSVCLCVVVCM